MWKVKKKNRHRRQPRRLCMENLEVRSLMSASHTLTDGVLLMEGTEAADSAAVYPSGDQVVAELNGSAQVFERTAVKRIVFRGHRGDDVFTNRTDIRSVAHGQQGNDVISGGSGNDVITGGSGNDKLRGNDGNDRLVAGTGADRLFGGAGDDLLVRQAATDQVFGQAGNDLYADRTATGLTWTPVEENGGAPPFHEEPASKVKAVSPSSSRGSVGLVNGRLTFVGTSRSEVINVFRQKHGGRWYVGVQVDGQTLQSHPDANVKSISVSAQDGNDKITVWRNIGRRTWVYGGSGNDVIYGGSGKDYIHGGFGRDTLYGRGGKDWVYGGPGSDRIQRDRNDHINSFGSPWKIWNMRGWAMDIVRLTNLERARHDLPPLRADSRLAAAAYYHARNMARLSHVVGNSAAHGHTLLGVDMPTMTDRFAFVGADYRAMGENVGYGATSPQAIVQAWMNSPGHRANILSPHFDSIGVCVVRNAHGTRFFCQNFGKPF